MNHRRRPPLLLALRALGLGDLLTSLPALRALARAFPEHHRVLVLPEPLAALAVHAGAADQVVPSVGLRPLPPQLSGADVAVNLHGKGPQSHRLLVARHPRRLVAFAHPEVPESADGPRWSPDEHEVRRWCRLLSASGIPADPGDLHVTSPDRTVPGWVQGATVVHPGAASEARRWPVGRFAEVARAERASGREVVVTGGPSERVLARALADQAGLDPSRVLAGRTDVLELATVVGRAGRLVAGDTGVAHLATALGTPSVVLFGPTQPRAWGPPPLPRHVVLWSGTAGDPHADVVDPGLAAIAVERVLHALARLPVGRPSSDPGGGELSGAEAPTAPG